MGFDYKKIPLINNSYKTVNTPQPLFYGNVEDIKVTDGNKEFDLKSYEKYRNLNFEPHPNWKGHIERD